MWNDEYSGWRNWDLGTGLVSCECGKSGLNENVEWGVRLIIGISFYQFMHDRLKNGCNEVFWGESVVWG